MRPNVPQDPTVKTGEELMDVSFAKVLPPAANNRVDLSDQPLCIHRCFAPRAMADLLLKGLDRFLARLRVEITLSGGTTNLAGRPRNRPTAPLDLVPKKLKTI
jgi:hypothetical protein